TSFLFSALSGVGYVCVVISSSNTIPLPFFKVSFNSSADTPSFSTSIYTLSACEVNTGSLTQVAATGKSFFSIIFFVSLIIFISSLFFIFFFVYFLYFFFCVYIAILSYDFYSTLQLFI